MDRRTILTMMLCLAFFYIWAFVTGFGEPPPGSDTDGSTEMAENTADATTPSVPTELTTESEQGTPDVPTTPVVDEVTPQIPVKTVEWEACDTRFNLTTDGGFIQDVTLNKFTEAYEMTPLYSWLIGSVTGSGDSEWKPYGDSPGAQNIATQHAQLLGMGSGSLESSSPRVQIIKHTDTELVFQGVTSNRIEVTRSLRVNQQSSPCVVESDFTWKNVGSTDFAGKLWLGMHDRMPPPGAGYYSQAAMPVWMAVRKITLAWSQSGRLVLQRPYKS